MISWKIRRTTLSNYLKFNLFELIPIERTKANVRRPIVSRRFILCPALSLMCTLLYNATEFLIQNFPSAFTLGSCLH